MKKVLYLAMTAAEFEKNPQPDFPMAWMACHFSAYGDALSNLPQVLPKGSLLILNDRTPISGHDSVRVARQLRQTLESLQCSGILLDLQRAGAQEIVRQVAALPCPVAVPPMYAADVACAVFLPPPSMTVPLERHIAPWRGRELWLEAATQRQRIRVSAQGSAELPPAEGACPHVDAQVHCRYGIDIRAEYVDFHMERDEQQLRALLREGESLGISRFVGLYQQLSSFSSHARAQESARSQP